MCLGSEDTVLSECHRRSKMRVSSTWLACVCLCLKGGPSWLRLQWKVNECYNGITMVPKAPHLVEEYQRTNGNIPFHRLSGLPLHFKYEDTKRVSNLPKTINEVRGRARTKTQYLSFCPMLNVEQVWCCSMEKPIWPHSVMVTGATHSWLELISGHQLIFRCLCNT